MIPIAPLTEILIVYQELGVAMKHGSFTYSKCRRDPLMLAKHEKGLMRYRLRFDSYGKLVGWDRYTYLRAIDTHSATIEPCRYHLIKYLDGVYDCHMAEKLTAGINVKKPVDTPVPADIK